MNESRTTAVDKARRRFGMAMSVIALTGLALAALALACPEALDAVYALYGPGHHGTLGDDGRLGAGIYGALMAGWGVHVALMARGHGLVQSGLWGLAVWWCIDSMASVILGYPINALSNTALLGLVVPAWIALRGATARG